MTRLDDSHARVRRLLEASDLASDAAVEQLLGETSARRRLDLSDLTPEAQARLIASRATNVLPSPEALAEAIAGALARPRPFIVKFGIDPTSSDVHLGHAVPMLILSRFQRMGHRIVFIVGDITAKIGDPSGRSDERPPLSDADISRNLSSYRAQVTPFFDFSRADFRLNSEWLTRIQLPRFIEILSQIPVSMSLQREDFRTRLQAGQGLAMSEFVYSVVMAIDSAEIRADVELGGLDQLLNMQMGRKVMEAVGQPPQHIVAMPLIEGTDGSGAKMSKSRGNYVALGASAEDIFGKVMSVPDRLIAPYLRAWTEWLDPEIERALASVEAQTLHPMDLKKLLAGEAVAAIHGLPAAMKARQDFVARFSQRSFEHLDALPTVSLPAAGGETVAAVLTTRLGFAASMGAARRLVQGKGLRFVFEIGAEQSQVILDEAALRAPLEQALRQAASEIAAENATAYLKAGKQLARLER